MKLTVASISLEGQTIDLTPNLGWVREIVVHALVGQNPITEGLNGNLEISRVDENVSLRGYLDVDLRPACDRCLEEFVRPLHVDIHTDLSPKSKITDHDEPGSGAGEVELTAEDIDFSFYQGPEIDVSEIIREQIVLALPFRFICAEECRGLCPQCGANLNAGKCGCVPVAPLDSRWEGLRKFKGS